MTKDKIIRFCDKVINILILGVIFLIPLYFNIFTYLSFEIDKIVLFRIIVELLLFLYLARVFLSGQFKLVVNKYFYLSIGFILLSQVLATIFSEHAYISFWGSYWRSLGLFTYLHIFVLAYLVFVYWDNKKIKLVFWVISLAGFLSSVYALVQVFGFDFLQWQGLADNQHLRASSTLGQPNFLASYLLLVLPATFYLLFLVKNFYKRIILSIFLLFQFLALIFTYSRAGWIGLILALIIFIFFYFYKKNKKVFLSILILFTVGVGLLFYIGIAQRDYTELNEDVSVVGRVKSLADFTQGSVGIRVLYYSAALDIIRNNFIVGYGLDNQSYYFYKYYTPDYAIYEKINVYPDRAHNEIMDILITTGIIGLASWFFLFYALFYQSKNFLNSQPNDKKILVLCLLFGILSSYISILFGFFTIVHLVYFWFYLAILFRTFSYKEKIFNFQIRKIISFIFLLTILVSFFLLIWHTNIKKSLADYYYREAKEASLQGDFSSSFSYFNKVIESIPQENYYRSQFAIEVMPSMLNMRDNGEKIFLLNHLKDIILKQNLNNITFEGRVYLAIVSSEIGKIKFEEGYNTEEIYEFKEASEIFKNLSMDAPGFSRLYYDWGNLYFYQEMYSEALDKYYQSLISYPSVDHFSMNEEHRYYMVREKIMVYKMIIKTKIAQEEYLSALFFCEKALELSPYDEQIKNFINIIKNNI